MKLKPGLLFAAVFLSAVIPAAVGTALEKEPVSRNNFTLSNGIPVYYQHDDSSRLTVLHLNFKGGKSAQPEGRQGLAYLTTRLMLEIPDSRKVQKIMKQGSRLSVLCKMDYSRINLSCLTENFKETLEIVSRIIRKPIFSGLRINKIKEEMRNRRKAEEDDSLNRGHNIVTENLQGGEGIGGSELGTEISLEQIKKADIKAFYENHINASNLIAVVVTDMEEETLRSLLEKELGKINVGQKYSPLPQNFTIPSERTVFEAKDSEQTMVSVAVPLPALTEKVFICGFLMETLLGKGVGSRLWPLRYERQLCYRADASSTYDFQGGVFEVFLETANEKRDEALTAIETILDGLVRDGIGQEEWQRNQAFARSLFVRGMETKEIRAQNLDFFVMSGIDPEILSRFSEVGLEEFNAVLCDILREENRIRVVIGAAPIDKDCVKR